MVFQQADDGERDETGDQRAALFPHVTAVLDRPDDRCVGGRSPDAEFLEGLDQARLGEARRRVGGVPARVQLAGGQAVALADVWQAAFTVLKLRIGVVGTLDVGAQEAREGDDLSRCRELGVLPGAGCPTEPDRRRRTEGVSHLAGDCPPPDQFVEPIAVDVVPECGAHLTGGLEVIPGRTDRLVRFLGVLDLLRVGAGPLGHVLRPVESPGLVPGGGERGFGQVRRVRTHIGDVAVFVQLLCHLHRSLAGEAQFAAGLLLQGGRHERRVGRAAVRLGLHRPDREDGVGEPAGQGARRGLVEPHHVRGGELAGGGEVASGGQSAAVERDQVRRQWSGVGCLGGCGPALRTTLTRGQRTEDTFDVPVLGRGEAHPGAFAFHQDAGCHALNPARRQPRHHLLPQHRADLIAVEPVEDPPRLLGVDEVLVDLARVVHRSLDGLRRDLVEDHSLHRHGRLQRLQQVPGDRLALAVLICGEVELAGVLDQGFELADLGFLVGGNDVERLEAVVDVHPEPRPRFALVRDRHLLGVTRQVPDVPDTGLDLPAGAEVSGDGLRLRGRLDDHQPGSGRGGSARRGAGSATTRVRTCAGTGRGAVAGHVRVRLGVRLGVGVGVRVGRGAGVESRGFDDGCR